MNPARILLVGGLDPTGRAGLGRDVAVAESERVAAAPVVSALTVQDADGVHRVQPIDESLLEASLQAAADRDLNAAKVGLLPDTASVKTVRAFLERAALPFVLDPVRTARGEHPLTTEDTVPALRRLATGARLVTPNVEELESLTGRRARTLAERRVAAQDILREIGVESVLVKGGHGDDRPGVDLWVGPEVREFPFQRLDLGDPTVGRGKGCELATRVAALLAKGVPLESAIPVALRRLHERLDHEVRWAGAPPPHQAACRQYEAALEQLLAQFGPGCVPEVGTNLAYATEDSRGPGDVVGLAGRVTIAGDSFAVTGRPRPGGPHHTGRIAYTARQLLGRPVWVFNHRYDPELAAHAVPDHVRLDRTREPSEASSTMEWMTHAAIRQLGRLPAYISDAGANGKEAMVRVLARTPEDLLERHARLHRGSSAGLGTWRVAESVRHG